MIRNAYLLRTMGIQPKTVIHVGSHHAQDQSQYELLGVENVFWCEADPECCQVIAKKYPSSKIVEGLFWSKENIKLDFWIMDDRAQNSTFAPRNTHSLSSKRRMLSTTLDAKFAGTSLLSPVLLVIDVQGSEIEVLKGGRELLSLVDYVVCEITGRSSISHFTVEQNEIESLLSEYSFVPVLKRMSHSKEYFDLLFIKSSLINVMKVKFIDSLFTFFKKSRNAFKRRLSR